MVHKRNLCCPIWLYSEEFEAEQPVNYHEFIEKGFSLNEPSNSMTGPDLSLLYVTFKSDIYISYLLGERIIRMSADEERLL